MLLDTKSVQLAPGVVLRVFENDRGPFGVGSLWLALVASLVVLLIFVRGSSRLTTHDPRPQRTALALVLGGGLANLGERMLFGHTTDVLWVASLTALNVADLAILGGLATLALSMVGRAHPTLR